MAIASRQIRSANKGLITERHGLGFAPEESVDELNCEVLVSQVRRRRKGINYESDYSLSTFTHTDGDIIAEESWDNVGGIGSLQFLVVQSGDTLYFYDKASSPISNGLKSFSVDLNNFDAGNSKVLATTPFQGASLNGTFVVAHAGCDLFYIEYDTITDTITTTQIDPKIRDFEYQGTIEDYYTNSSSATVSAAREYDTLNSGWDDAAVPSTVTKPLTTFIASKSAYPSLTKPWYSGKNASDLFTVSEWDKVWSGNTLSGNGHYILDFFSKNREQYVTGAGIETEDSRFASVTAYAGRFWYAGLDIDKNGGTVLFTRVIQSALDYERCYQIADPTAEDISDLIADDGGVIVIPEAYGIKKLYPFGTTVLVFAENGVWQIAGVDGVFKATQYSISRITNFGIYNPLTFIDAGGQPFWWSDVGIHTIGTDRVSGSGTEQNISRESIQTFWNNINNSKKLQAKAAFDEDNNKLYWMYPSNDESIDYKYNKILILDLVNQAFLPWTISDQASNTNSIVGMAYFKGFASVDEVQDVTVNGVTVTENTVTVTWDGAITISATDSQVKFICKDGASGKLTIGVFGDTTFLDWGDTNYTSYFSLGYDHFDNPALHKGSITLVTFFERTEDGWTSNGDGSYSPTNPSGCTLEAFWDFRTSGVSSQNVYRIKSFPVVDAGDLTSFNYPTTVIDNRTRIKGNGRVLNLKFTSEQGKEFRFMGYEVVVDKYDTL